VIHVAGLAKAYGERMAVDGIDFAVAPGEAFGLLGPNGAGKTTTMRLLAGLLAPDRGAIDIDGAGDPRGTAARRRLGLAPQALALYADLTAAENLTFFGRLYGLAAARLAERVAALLDFVGLAERAGARVATFSGGMARRLNLACALVHEPRVLLLDEPMVGVDIHSRNRLVENIRALTGAGCTVLYTTHYMEEAESLCDRVAVLDHGRILACDRVEALVAAHGGAPRARATFAEPPSETGDLPGTVAGRDWSYVGEDAAAALAAVQAKGMALRAVKLEQPNLESVFLNLTGRSLRD
jgi:ABC-2 type transport system ATP-binding protein